MNRSPVRVRVSAQIKDNRNIKGIRIYRRMPFLVKEKIAERLFVDYVEVLKL